MSNSDPISRRTVVNAAGLAAASAALAGCIDESSVDDSEPVGDDESSSDETEPAADGRDDEGADDEGADAGENGDESGDDTVRIEPGTEIVFRAESLAWHGKEPSDIEDVENPTLVLTEGESYTIGWDASDGHSHNFALWDDEGSAIDATELTAEPDYESQSIEFEAASDIAEYVCEPHADSGMRGDIEVVSDDGHNEETDDENGEENDDRPQFEIDPATRIEFEATTADWTGLAPSEIEGESNPTLILERGEAYAIGWTQGDGAYHNIEIRNEDDEVVDDLSTEVGSASEEQWLEFEATEEMAIYACAPHEVTMRGEIRIAD